MSYVRTGGIRMGRRGLGLATFAPASTLRPRVPVPTKPAILRFQAAPTSPSIIPIVPFPRPVVVIGKPPSAPVSINPVLQASGIKVITPLPGLRNSPILSVPNSILPPKDLTISRPLPPVLAPTVQQALLTPDTIVNTPAGPVAVPAANSPSYSGGGDGGSTFTGGGGVAPSYTPEPEETEEAAAPPAEAAAPTASSGIMSGPLPWIIGGGLALWLLTRK